MTSSLRTFALVAIVLLGGAVVASKLNSTSASAPRTYVGQQTCMTSGCHEQAYGDGSIYAGKDEFMKTFHQKIHLRPSPQTVRIERYFEGDSVLMTPYTIGNVTDTLIVKLSKDQANYFAQMWMASGDSTPKMPVTYTYGGNGWIQRYLVELNGHNYVLPFQFILPDYKDLSDTGTTFVFLDLNKWAVDDPNTNPPSIKFFGASSTQLRVKSWDYCAPCHINGVSTMPELNGSDTVYTTTWAGFDVDSATRDMNISIGCESCHGPGSEHVANPTAGDNIVSPSKFGNTFQGTQLKLDLCDQCHNRNVSTNRTLSFPYDESTHTNYVPGTSLNDFIYGGAKGQQAGGQIWPDSSNYAHHQQGQDYQRSVAYQKHVFKNGCYSCHTVHYNKAGLPFQLDRDWYSLTDGEGCVSCHGSAGASLPEKLSDLSKTEVRGDGKTYNLHTQHLESISQCVNCHFSKTASISFIDLPTKPLYDFTTHSFKVIRPDQTRKLKDGINFLGQINTCAEACHRNGRGSRNFRPTDPVAPDYGIVDQVQGKWNDPTDLALADSLWYYYQRMYGTSDVPSGPATGAAVSSISMVVPNPFSRSATVSYTIATGSDVTLEILDLQGKSVRLLAFGRHEVGSYSKEWDGVDDAGVQVASGTYLVRLSTASGVSTQKVVLMR